MIALAPTALGGRTNSTVASGPTRVRPLTVRDRVGVGGVIGGRYEVAEFIAEGAFGAVYQACDLDVPGHVVALKLMHEPPRSEEERERCLREVQLIAAVSHPGVVSFKDHGLHKGRFYIVMPWYEGRSLAQRLEREGPLSRKEAREIFQQLADALAAIHASGIRHQDVKPENILLARFGSEERVHPVLLDMGVGAWGHELVPAFTPAYVAPEMARTHLALREGKPPGAVDGKADVFALALTLFDALAPGERQASRCTGETKQLERRAEHGAELPLPKALADVNAAFARWLSIDPQQRPTARELSRELSVLTRCDEEREERKRLRARLAPALLAGVCVVAMLVFLLGKERVQSKVKDQRLGVQAAQIDEAREALSAAASVSQERAQEAMSLSVENDGLVAMLDEARAQRAQLQRALEAEQRALRDLKRELKQTGERALELEASSLELTEKLAEQTRARNEAARALAHATAEKRAYERENEALIHERNALLATLSRETDERAQLAHDLEATERRRVELSEELARHVRIKVPLAAPLADDHSEASILAQPPLR
jgi:hypothetical protein